MNNTEDDGVRYSVKELFAKVDEKLDRALEKLDGKVERQEYNELEHRVGSLERWRWIVTGFVVCAQFAFILYLKLV